MKFQSKLMLAVIPIPVIVYIIITLTSTFFYSSSMERQIQQNTGLLSLSYASQLENTLKQYRMISDDLGNAVITSINVETTLQVLRRKYPEFSNIYYTPISGQVLHMTPYNASYLNRDFSEFQEWQQAIKTKKTIISQPLILESRESVLLFAPAMLGYLHNSAPQVTGVVVLVLPLEELFASISGIPLGNDSSIIISDNSGRILHSSPHVSEAHYISELAPDYDFSEYLKNVVQGQTRFKAFTQNGETKFITFSAVHQTKWMLGIHGNYGQIISEVQTVMLINLGIIIIAVLLGSVVTYFAVHAMVSPIEDLTRTAQKIASGDRSIVNKLEDNTEVGILSKTINYMVSELRQSHEKLEETVNERTYELQQVNEELAQTNEELNSANDHLIETQNNLERIVSERTQRVQELAFLVESTSSPIALSDLKGTINYINPAFLKSWGYALTEEVINNPIENFWVLPSKSTEFINKVQTEKELSFEEQAIHAEGHFFEVFLSVSLVQNENGEDIAICYSSPDISDKKQTEWELSKARNYINNIINSMPSMLIGVNNKGTITQWNQEAERQSNIPAHEAVGKQLVHLMPRLINDIDKVFNAIHEKKKYEHLYREHVSESGISSFENLTVYPLMANGVDGAVLRIDNVTERVNLEESLRQSQKMDAIGQLAGGVAHDFNNMLGGIMGSAEMLKLKLPENDKHHKYIHMILDSAKNAADLTRKLLTLSRKSVRDFTSLDIHQCIKENVQLLERTIDKKISVSFSDDAANSFINGDIAQISNCILNLGINAAHAMPVGGKLEFRTSNESLDSHYCEKSSFALLPGEYLRLDITDNGIGMPAEILQKIFDPFFTTKSLGEGTGLGLATVYSAIKQHKGCIAVYSIENEGTTFTIHLPVSSQINETKVELEGMVHGTGTVLVIDDEKIIRAAAEDMLSTLGYTVLTAKDGREGIQTYSENMQEIDIILLDMIMPEINGKECFREIRKINPRARIIVTSGFSRGNDLQAIKEEGLNAVIEKPYQIKELSRTIARVIAG